MQTQTPRRRKPVERKKSVSARKTGGISKLRTYPAVNGKRKEEMLAEKEVKVKVGKHHNGEEEVKSHPVTPGSKTVKPEKAKKVKGPLGQEGQKPATSQFSKSENYEKGKVLREKCPRESHAHWKPSKDRPDPVKLVLESGKGRFQDLLPLRHGRMAMSPFTFYRGAALNMAADLAATPNSGITVQCCGDAHLMNFGGFATPERRVIFSINDLDETNPAPWEWDLKRLATSFVIASRNNGIPEDKAREMALKCVNSYRTYMAEYSKMKLMELWYHVLDSDTMIKEVRDPDVRKRALKRLAREKEGAKNVAEEIFPKLAESKNGFHRIKDQLPSIFHMGEISDKEMESAMMEAFENYKKTLNPAYQVLLNHFQIKDVAIKVVGIGSVGTLCWILLLMDADENPFFLQVKEARESVLEKYTTKSAFENHGQRIVNGYKLMQPYSDIFLGWTHGKTRNKDYFVRQLRNMKIKILVETFGEFEMEMYAGWCGQALALSHARSGDSSRIAGYIGKSDAFDEAIASFSVAYANQNENDFNAFKRAIRSGKVKAIFEEV